MFSINCLYCDGQFSTRRVLFSHQRSVHNISPDVLGIIYCPWCSMEVEYRKALRRHMRTCHGMDVRKEFFKFDTLDEFYKWKNEMEINTQSSFLSYNALRTLNSGVKTITFHCQRAGLCAAISEDGKICLPSIEMQATCPASIEVTEWPTKTVGVVFWNGHAGCGDEFLHPFSVEEDVVKAYRRAKIYDDHLESRSVTRNMVREVTRDSWNVRSSKSARNYRVQRVKCPTWTRCKFSCVECNVCVHMFTCTCEDYGVGHTMCKHIHACIGLNEMEFLFDASSREDDRSESAYLALKRRYRRTEPLIRPTTDSDDNTDEERFLETDDDSLMEIVPLENLDETEIEHHDQDMQEKAKSPEASPDMNKKEGSAINVGHATSLQGTIVTKPSTETDDSIMEIAPLGNLVETEIEHDQDTKEKAKSAEASRDENKKEGSAINVGHSTNRRVVTKSSSKTNDDSVVKILPSGNPDETEREHHDEDTKEQAKSPKASPDMNYTKEGSAINVGHATNRTVVTTKPSDTPPAVSYSTDRVPLLQERLQILYKTAMSANITEEQFLELDKVLDTCSRVMGTKDCEMIEL